jgi:hypothetical protein
MCRRVGPTGVVAGSVDRRVSATGVPVAGRSSEIDLMGARSEHEIEVPGPPRLGDTEQELLLGWIPRVLERAVGLGGAFRDEQREDELSGPIPAGLLCCSGAFVSLYRGAELRGCIGRVRSGRPLWRLVEEMAVAAATSDPRFSPLEQRELEDLRFEVSVLGPLVAVPPSARDPEGAFVRVGEHGIQLVRGSASGLLLPQVAVKYRWDGIRFLEEAARKAELPLDAWREQETGVFLFRALCFGGGH